LPTLDGPRRDPRSGSTRSLVVLLHGYGADGNDLFGLAEPVSEYLPDTVFRAPNAPEPCRVNPMGRQWFPIPQIDGSAEAEMRESYIRACETLDAYLREAMEAEGVGPERTCLLGFSQGTMMALSVGPRRSPGLAGIVGFSGRLIDPDGLALAESRPPVLLVHGDRDEVVPHSSMAEAQEALAGLGFPVSTFTSREMGHGIAPDGLGLAVGFLAEKLGISLGKDGRPTAT
jgi:phospholipase/carboxylesterase